MKVGKYSTKRIGDIALCRPGMENIDKFQLFKYCYFGLASC